MLQSSLGLYSLSNRGLGLFSLSFFFFCCTFLNETNQCVRFSLFSTKKCFFRPLKMGDLVVTSIENHRIIHLFNIIKIFNKLKIFDYHLIQNFSKNVDLRKQDFLSQEEISHLSLFVNKDVLRSWINIDWKQWLISDPLCLHCLHSSKSGSGILFFPDLKSHFFSGLRKFSNSMILKMKKN